MIVTNNITPAYVSARYNSFKWMDKTRITNHLAMFDIAIQETNEKN